MEHSFDYVVVGAGSAGSVIAARLTEDPSLRVALIEAGGSDLAAEVSVPVTFPRLFKTSFDWDFSSEPEPALGGRRIYLPRGKMLGGTSSMNAMVYIRGNPADFDQWSAAGASGWSWREMLPYFRKAEGNGRGSSELHGDRGPLSVTDGRSLHPLADRFVAAGVAAGHPENDDFNGPRQLGVGRYQLTQRNGARCSAADAYLRPALQRPNLKVFSDRLTERIALDGRRATGVVVTRNGQQQTLSAGREVIVSAGAYGSPQLLLLSGIGPSAELAPLGIRSALELPVGEGLQDHPLVLLCYLTDEASLFRAGTEADFRRYATEQSGPLTSNLCEAGGFLSTRRGVEVPDIQLQMAPVMYVDEALSAPSADAFSLGPCLLAPTSRGKVSLRSARPDAKPRILNNFLATEADRRALLDGLRHALRIAEQAPLAEVRRGVLRAPASEREEDLWAFVQRELCTNYHPVGSCGIGRVVDARLRVLGIDGLRVADASIMPSIIRGNTNAAVIAIGEKAVDLLRL